VGNSNIAGLYASAISPNQTFLAVGGNDASFSPSYGFWTLMSFNSFTLSQSFWSICTGV